MAKTGRRRWGWRILKGFGIAVGSILALVALVVAVVLVSPWATEKAARTFLDFFNDRVPGAIEIASIEGAVGGELRLSGLRIEDGEGRPMLVVERIVADLRLPALLSRTLAFEALRVDGPTLYVGPRAGDWKALSAPKPPQPTTFPGPELRIGFELEPLIAGGTVVSVADASTVVATSIDLQAALEVGFREATVELEHLAAHVPGPDLWVTGARGEIAWSAPLVRVTDLFVQTSAGALVDLDATLDTVALTWSTDLGAIAFPRPIGEATLPPSRLELAGYGNRAAAVAQVQAAVPSIGEATLEVAAKLDDPYFGAWGGRVTLQPEALARLGLPALPSARVPLALTGMARFHDGTGNAVALLASDAWVVALQALQGADDGGVRASVILPGGTVIATADLGRDFRPRSATAEVAMSSLSSAVSALEPWLPADAVPEDLAGELRVTARCDLQPAVACTTRGRGTDLRVQGNQVGQLELEGQVALAEGSPTIDAQVRLAAVRVGEQRLDRVEARVQGDPKTGLDVEARVRRDKDRAQVALTVRPGEPLRIDLQELDVRAGRFDLDLRNPSAVTVAPTYVDVDALAIDVAGGTVQVDGRLAWEGRSDLRIAARGLDLSTLRDVAPGLRLSGRVWLEADLEGTDRAPRWELQARTRDLAWDGHRLAKPQLRARLHDDRAALELLASSAPADLRLFVELPLELRLRPFSWRIPSRQPFAFSLALDQLYLGELRSFLPKPALQGRVDLEVKGAGTPVDPTFALVARGFHLQVDRIEIGNARVQAEYGDGRASANVYARGGKTGELEVAASVPLSLDLANLTAPVSWRRDERHRLAVNFERTQLSLLDAVLDEPSLGGVLSGSVLAVADATHREARVDLLGTRIEVADHDWGALTVKARVSDRAADAHLQWSGAAARLLELRAHLPLVPGKPLAVPEIDPRAPMALALHLEQVELTTIADVTSVPLAGEASGKLTVGGTLAEPRMGAALAVQRLAFRREPVGAAELELAYDGTDLAAHFEHRLDAAKTSARIALPLELDLAQRRFRVPPDQRYTVALRAVGLDEALLRPFAAVPEAWDFRVALELAADGTLEAPRGNLRARGVFQQDEALATPVSVLVALEPDEQRARILIGAHPPRNLTVDARTDAPLADLLAGRAEVGAIQVLAEVEARDFPLRDLEPLLPPAVYEPAGMLQLHARAEGPLTAPELSGKIAVRDGGITVLPLHQRFEDIELVASLEEQQLRLATLQAKSGRGRVQADGGITLARGQVRGQLEVRVRDVPVVRPGLPMLEIDTNVEAQLDATGETTEVEVVVANTLIDVIEGAVGAPEKLASWEGVSFVRDLPGESLTEATTEGGGQPWLPQPVRLAIAIDDQARVRGTNIDMAWGGRMVLVNRAGQPPDVQGALRSRRGTVELLGNEFDITEGEVWLPPEGDPDPFINLTAVTTLPDAEITMTLRGRVSRPELRLTSSDASLTETELFSLLLTGQRQPGEGESASVETRAASLLAAVQNPVLQRQLQETVGLDRVSLGFGEQVTEPIVRAGKRLTKNLYLETQYHANAPRDENRAEVSLEYMFFPPSWSLETFFGDRREGGLAVWWRKRFRALGAGKDDDEEKEGERKDVAATGPEGDRAH